MLLYKLLLWYYIRLYVLYCTFKDIVLHCKLKDNNQTKNEKCLYIFFNFRDKAKKSKRFSFNDQKKKRKIISYFNIHTGVPAIPGAPESPFRPWSPWKKNFTSVSEMIIWLIELYIGEWSLPTIRILWSFHA